MKKPKSHRQKKPKRKPSPTTAVTNTTHSPNPVWRTLLLWGGILGGALTIFGNMQTFVEMSHWARFIVSRWNSWTFSFWAYFARLIGHEPSHEAAAILTFINSLMLISFSAMVFSPRDSMPVRDNTGPWPWQWSDSYWTHWSYALASGFFALLIFNLAIELIVFKTSFATAVQNFSWVIWAMVGAVSAATTFNVLAHGFRRMLPYAALAACISVFYFLIASSSAESALREGPEEVQFYRKAVLEFSFGFFPLQMAGLLTMADAGYLLLRFGFIGGGVLLLYLMNLISASGVSITAPV